MLLRLMDRNLMKLIHSNFTLAEYNLPIKKSHEIRSDNSFNAELRMQISNLYLYFMERLITEKKDVNTMCENSLITTNGDQSFQFAFKSRFNSYFCGFLCIKCCACRTGIKNAIVQKEFLPLVCDCDRHVKQSLEKSEGYFRHERDGLPEKRPLPFPIFPNEYGQKSWQEVGRACNIHHR